MPVRCVFHLMRNIHSHFGSHDWFCPTCPELFPICIHTHSTHNSWQKHKFKTMLRNQKTKGTLLIIDRYFLNRLGYFKMSISSKYMLLHLQQSLYAGSYKYYNKIYLLIFKCSYFQSHYAFASVSNLNNFFQRY